MADIQNKKPTPFIFGIKNDTVYSEYKDDPAYSDYPNVILECGQPQIHIPKYYCKGFPGHFRLKDLAEIFPWYVCMSLFETLVRSHACCGSPGTFACPLLNLDRTRLYVRGSTIADMSCNVGRLSRRGEL